MYSPWCHAADDQLQGRLRQTTPDYARLVARAFISYHAYLSNSAYVDKRENSKLEISKLEVGNEKTRTKKREISKLEVGNEKTRTKKQEISKLEVGNEKTRNW